MSFNLDQFDSDDELLLDLGCGIWLMDNHKWAILAWDTFKTSTRSGCATLVHADYHWDGVNDFHRASQFEMQQLLDADAEKLSEIIRKDEKIKCDSFIAPAVIRGIIADIHLFCRQKDQDNIGLSDDLLRRHGITQTIHKSVHSLAAQSYSQPLIFDLCLDLFNESEVWDEGDLWPDIEILQFLSQIKHLVQTANVITVSASFGWSGSQDDTRHLAKLVLPLLKQWRG
jgi:hypothetical protein